MSVEGALEGFMFERILLDAPCSATGVIRRHPDIKLLRRETDIVSLVATQKKQTDAQTRLAALRAGACYTPLARCCPLKMSRSLPIFWQRSPPPAIWVGPWMSKSP